MTPDEVIQALNKIGEMEGIGLVMTRPTLLRYETQGLIPKPQRGGRGRGAGRWTEYPAGTVEQAYAAWCLMHGVYGGKGLTEFLDSPPKIKPLAIKNIRESYFRGIDMLRVSDEYWEGLSNEDRIKEIENNPVHEATEDELVEWDAERKKEAKTIRTREYVGITGEKLCVEKLTGTFSELEGVLRLKAAFGGMYEGLLDRGDVVLRHAGNNKGG